MFPWFPEVHMHFLFFETFQNLQSLCPQEGICCSIIYSVANKAQQQQQQNDQQCTND